MANSKAGTAPTPTPPPISSTVNCKTLTVATPFCVLHRPTEGEVVKVGPGRIASTGATAEIMLKPGDNVKFRDYAGTEVRIGGDYFMVMYATDVLAKW
jgi:co-chaperonin GroES (HSP10)